ncbi:MAG: extracellular solute-binding protein [Oscillospiraceae bacterium]|nr:extracellular solute-binding protein [Oscillospiraceae bacterium]
MKCKRIFAAVTALCLLLCGCQNPQKPEDSTVQQENAATEADGSVTSVSKGALTTKAQKQDFPFPDGLNFLFDFKRTADGMACLGSGMESVFLCKFNADFSSPTTSKLVTPASYDGYYCAGVRYVIGEDQIYSIAIMENHSNMEPYRVGMEDYDWDTYNATWESDYFLCTNAMDGTLTSAVPIEKLENYLQSDGNSQINQLCIGDGVLWLTMMDGRILKIALDGTLEEAYVPELQGNEHIQRAGILFDRDGKSVYTQYRIDTVPGDGHTITKILLSEFDRKTGAVSEPFCTVVEDPDVGFTPMINSGGQGDYRMFVSRSDALYGIKDDGTLEEVINWEASDLTVLQDIVPLEDGTFLGTSYENGIKIYRLTRQYESEQTEELTITIGVLGSGEDISDFVRKFNQTNENIRVKIVSYENSDGTYYGEPNGANDALQNFKLDIISDNAPDIIYMRDTIRGKDSHETIMQLGKRGAFLDLYDFMEEDAEINRSTLVPNVVEAAEAENGALYAIPQEFSISTMAVKSRLFDRENWTVDDMIDLYADATENQYKWLSQNDALQMLLYGTDFTDEEKGTCSFNSPEFIEMLEFCRNYPVKVDEPEKNYDDPDAMAKLDKFLYDQSMKYLRDEDYLCPLTLGRGDSYAAGGYSYAKYGDMGEEITLVGYPSNNGEGGKIVPCAEIAISSACKDTAAAWQVVKAFLYPENYNGYSIVETKFETQLDDEMYIMDFEGRSDAEYYDNQGWKIYPLTQEERDDLEDYIRSCDTVMTMNENVVNIVLEEAEMYFAGDLSAEDAAKRIQSRTEILVSEQN